MVVVSGWFDGGWLDIFRDLISIFNNKLKIHTYIYIYIYICIYM